MKRAIFITILILISANFANAETKVQRLAIIASGGDESKKIADLLFAKLAEVSEIELVEREEISKVLAEQRLSESSYVDALNRIKLGKLLRAKGLIFIGKYSKEEKLYVKMTETAYGFQVANLAFFAKKNETDVEALSESIATDIKKLAIKFDIDPKKTLLVSVFRVGNATLSIDNEWIEDDGPMLVESELSGYNNLLILERRHLGELMAEKALTDGPVKDFLTSTYLLDAEITRQKSHKSDDSLKVELNIMVKSIDGKVLNKVSEAGTLKQFPMLVRKGVNDVVKNLFRLKKSNTDSSASVESKLWLKLAERNWNIEKWERPDKSFTSAETAYALSPKNRKARLQMVRSLTAEAINHTMGRLSEKDCLKRAKLLEKALIYCLPPENRKERQAFYFIAAGSNSGFLSKRATVDYKSVREILRPVRRMVVKAGIENTKGRIKSRYGVPELEYSLSACSVFPRASYCMFETPYEAALFFEPELNKILESPKLSRNKKLELLDSAFNGCGPFWGRHYSDFPWDKNQSRKIWIPIFKKLGENPDKLVKMFAYKMLASTEFKKDLQIKNTKKCLDLYYDYLCEERKKGDPLVNISAFRLIRELSKKEQASYYKKVYYSSVERKDIDCYLNLRSFVFMDELIKVIPPKESYDIIDNTLKFLKECKSEAKQKIEAESVLLAYKSDLIKKHPELNRSETEFDIKVLWDRHRDLGKEFKIRRRGLLVPQRMLVEGETLWASFGTTDWGASKRDVALARINLKTGKTLSFRAGNSDSVKEDTWRGDYYGENSQICRFKEWICVGQADVGVYLFPENCDKTDKSLKNVRLLNKKSGLPNTLVTVLAPVGDDLYIGLSGRNSKNNSLVKWNCKSEEVEVLASISRTGSNNPLDGGYPWEMHALLPSPDQKSIYIFISDSVSKGRRAGIWKYSIAEKTYKKLFSCYGSSMDRTITAKENKAMICGSFGLHVFDAENETLTHLYGNKCRGAKNLKNPIKVEQLTSTPSDIDENYLWTKAKSGNNLLQISLKSQELKFIIDRDGIAVGASYDMVSTKFGLVVIQFSDKKDIRTTQLLLINDKDNQK